MYLQSHLLEKIGRSAINVNSRGDFDIFFFLEIVVVSPHCISNC